MCQIKPMEGEHVLEDNYPVFMGFWYVCDGEPLISPIQGTIAELKIHIGAKEIRNCIAVQRNLNIL